MPEFVTQPSFASGEIGPELYGRVDQSLYYIGLRTCRNFIVRQYGGIVNRPGTKIISEHKDRTKKVRLMPFTFNEQQTYVLQIGEGYTRFIRNAGEILQSDSEINITGATQANPVVITTDGSHSFVDGEDVFITGVAGMVELNGRTFRVTNATPTTIELYDTTGMSINGTAYTAYSSGGTATKIYEIETPWQEEDLFSTGLTGQDLKAINRAQSNDVLTITHNDYYPRDLTRTDNDAWTIGEFPNVGGPFLDINVTDTTVYIRGETSLAVTGAADNGSGLIRITVSDTSNLATGDSVQIYGVTGTTEANGTWTITVIDGTNFDLQGSTFSNAYSSDGTVKTNLTATSSVDVVSSDDLFDSTMVGELFYIEQEPDDDIDRWEPGKSVNANDIRRAGAHYYEAQNSGTTGTYRPDWVEGSSTDGDGAVEWAYFHSGFGILQITAYTDAQNVTADIIKRPPERVVGSSNTTDNWAKAAWSETQGYPGACSYHKQRFDFGGTIEEPNRIWMSSTNLRADFSKSFPILDDESITVVLNTTGANGIRHLISFSELIALTSASEHLVDGVDGVLLASGDIFNKVQGYTGSSPVPPIIVNDTALFVQDMGNVIRSLRYQFESDTFGGIDLTARSPHLFIGKRVVDWDYQRHPFSVIWIVLDDGSLIGLTYMAEQQVIAMHRHDSSASASYESVACIREGTETATYFAVKRTIDGKTRRYVERLNTRIFNEVRDAYFVDCGLSYDGRNTGTTTMTITGGTTWDSPESLTISASSDVFFDTDVDTAQLVFWVGDIAYRLDITAYANASEVTGVPVKEIPEDFRAMSFTNWEIARSVFQPLHHIEGELVSILSDGAIVDDKTVSSGKVTLDNPGAVVHIGLPYTCDMETLDLAVPQGQTKGSTFNIPRVLFTVQETRAFYVSTEGLSTDDTLTDLRGSQLIEIKQREPQDGYDRAIPAETQVFEVNINSSWNKKGRVAVRQNKPLPLTINAVTPEVELGED